MNSEHALRRLSNKESQRVFGNPKPPAEHIPFHYPALHPKALSIVVLVALARFLTRLFCSLLLLALGFLLASSCELLASCCCLPCLQFARLKKKARPWASKRGSFSLGGPRFLDQTAKQVSPLVLGQVACHQSPRATTSSSAAVWAVILVLPNKQD